MAHATSGCLAGAALGIVLAAAGCASGPARVVGAPETVAALRSESRIVAVHYEDTAWMSMPGENGKRQATWAMVGAPTRRIKDRFVQGMQRRLRPDGVRSIPEPRIAYLGRAFMPEAHWLQRTFARGLVFDFYSPRRLWRPGYPVAPAKIFARLVRLDDLAVLWADSCAFNPAPFQAPPEAARDGGPEALYTPAALGRADACAETLLTSILDGSRR